MARTAVVAGTATAVGNRVSRRQAGRWAEKDQAAAYQQQQQYAQPQYAQPQYAQPQPQYVQPQPQPQYVQPAPPPPATAPDADDMFDKLRQLGELRDQGILTEAEFAAQKAKLLAG
jgi:hypothetical protein